MGVGQLEASAPTRGRALVVAGRGVELGPSRTHDVGHCRDPPGGDELCHGQSSLRYGGGKARIDLRCSSVEDEISRTQPTHT